MSNSKKTNSLVKLVTYILLILLIACLIFGVIKFIKRNVGVYVTYGDTTILADNDGIVVDFSESTATFTINNSNGWGAYKVEDCSVKVINNVSGSSTYDFEYSVGNQLNLFSLITDFSSLFTTDGGEIAVSSDGTFTLVFKYSSMQEYLEAYEGASVVISGEASIFDYPYFAIQIITPDESETITIPFVFDGYVKLNYTELFY